MLNRFISAQESTYSRALSEIKAGQKKSHWMWFVFPQLKALGRSQTAQFYGLQNLQEAKDYLVHPVLGTRLKMITSATLQHPQKTPLQIFGHPDNLKFHSCLTLFGAASPADIPIFAEALALFFEGKADSATLTLLSKQTGF